MRLLGHNHNIKDFIVSQIWLVKIINFFFNLKNRKKFNVEVDKREKTSLFNYEKLIESLSYAPDEVVIDNNLYGIAYWLKKYSGIDTTRSLNAYIEHGVYFGNLVREDQKRIPVRSIITYSNIREKHLKEVRISKKIIKVGPYIHYVDGLLSSEEKNILKNELGKTLLVFPSHSIIGVNAQFDEDEFIKKIEEIAVNFDTVLVSLYWVDATKRNLVKQYENKGYKIVTSGHRFDLNFLSRQRTLIELSDYTMSNSVGTHIGYCVYLNKPHYVFKQEVEKLGDTPALQQHFDKVRNEKQLFTEEQEIQEVERAFSSFYSTSDITEEQRKVVDKYWGVEYIRTPQVLKNMLSII